MHFNKGKAYGRQGKAPKGVKFAEALLLLNMRNAYENLLAKIKGEELDRDYGLLEASLLKEIHRVVLQDIPLPKGLTKPGEMSNKPRMTEFRGEIYYLCEP